MESKLEEWAKPQSYTLYKSLIQSENAKCIGWLLYSNSYTDTDLIKKILLAQTDFEWGFKYQSVTQTDSETEWKKRLKAMSVMVPASKADETLM